MNVEVEKVTIPINDLHTIVHALGLMRGLLRDIEIEGLYYDDRLESDCKYVEEAMRVISEAYTKEKGEE